MKNENTIQLIVVLFAISLTNVLQAQNRSEQFLQKSFVEYQETEVVPNAPDSLLVDYQFQPEAQTTGWQEIGMVTTQYIYCGPGYYYDPELYLAAGQYRLLFYTYPAAILIRMEIRYDGGDWITVRDNGQWVDSGYITPPWDTPGEHIVEMRWWDLSGNINYHTYPVKVTPPRDKVYADDNGNRVDVWFGGNTFDRPLAIAEGIDAGNITYPPELYYLGRELYNTIRDFEVDVAIMSYNEGGIDIAANAGHFDNAIRYLHTQQDGTQQMIVAGVSMGGVVGRYALAAAEGENDNLPVSDFISLDAPHQDAVFDVDFQNELQNRDQENQTLQSTAAKQLLRENVFDSNDLHDQFYLELNSLNNGFGYPQNTTNIGVAFSNNQPNPNVNQRWLRLTGVPGNDPDFYINDAIAEPGSFLPQGTPQAFGRYISGLFEWELERFSDPTFIPHASALDIVNGQSRFDITIQPSQTSYHDVIPGDVVEPVLAGLGLLPESTESIRFWTKSNSVDLGSQLIVDEILTVNSGGTLNLIINEIHDVVPVERIIPDPFGNGAEYQHHYWNDNEVDFTMSLEFWGWDNNYTETAQFQNINEISINNNILGSIISMEIQDPWLSQNETDFTEITGGIHEVFLNQNDQFQDGIPIYRLRAPNIGGATQSEIYVFDQWVGTAGEVDFGDGATSTTDRTTDVVFKTSGATVTAQYVDATNIPDYTLTIPPEETLTLPAGGDYTLAEGFTINVQGAVTVQGTAAEPMEMTGSGGEANFETISAKNTMRIPPSVGILCSCDIH